MNSVITAVLNSLWQAAAIAAFAWAILKFSPKMNAATRHAVWWAVLAAVIALPAAQPLMQRSRTSPVTVYEVPVAEARPIYGPAAPPASATVPVAAIELRPGAWPVILPALWLAALLFQVARILRSYCYVRGLKRRASPAGPEAQRSFDTWLRSCRIARPARLLVSNEIASPLAAGFVHPAVILPESLLAHFREDQLDHVLLHELAHLARRDDWTNLTARLAAAVVALNPVAAWVLRRIEKERELACDDWVVSHTGEARPYAASLARLFEICFARRRVLLASGMADRASHLGERIEELLRRREFAPKASALKVGASALVLAGLALIAAGTRPWIAFAHPPQTAPAPGMPQRARPAQVAVRSVEPAPQPGGFLAALVAAGYGDLDVDEIIALKNSGITAEFISAMRKSGWGKLPPRSLIDLRNHGVRAAYAEEILEAGVKDLTIGQVTELHDRGVRPEYVREIHALGFGPFEARELIELQNRGVRTELFRALKEARFVNARPKELVEAQESGLRDSDLREARQFGSSLTLQQIVKLKHSGVLR